MVKGQDILELLLQGNQRYTSKNQKHPNQTETRRVDLKKGQNPHTIILGCSDSRAPPEIIFDQGLGDMFVVRVAGNVINDVVIGSIEYAAEHLGAPLLMVLGHSGCGAVKAAIDDNELDGHLPSITEIIEEAVRSFEGLSGELNTVVKAHTRITAIHLMESKPVLASLVESDRLLVVSAFYDFETGKVEILDQ